jgi:hypothetical protein
MFDGGGVHVRAARGGSEGMVGMQRRAPEQTQPAVAKGWT